MQCSSHRQRVFLLNSTVSTTVDAQIELDKTHVQTKVTLAVSLGQYG